METEHKTDDTVLSYLCGQKEILRASFRRAKAKHDELQAQCLAVSAELDAIKSRLSFIDGMQADRTRELLSAGDGTFSLPSMGRFQGLGAQEAVKMLFDSDSSLRLPADQILSRLVADGFSTNSSNPSALIFSTCHRMVKNKQLRQLVLHGEPRLFTKLD